MADEEDGVFYGALRVCYDKLDSAINSKCNMNQTVRDEARNALVELKSLIAVNFERIKSSNYREACRESVIELLAGQTDPSDVAPSVTNSLNQSRDMKILFTGLKEEFASFRMDITDRVENISKHICPQSNKVKISRDGVATTSGVVRIDG
jgi:hypothetical protein